MIAIDVVQVETDGSPFSPVDLTAIINNNYLTLIEFFNSCVTDSLVLNTVSPFPPDYIPGEPFITRYYAINTVKATEFQERFVSITAPFSMKQFWEANGFEISSATQTQIVFEDEPADQLTDLVDVNDNLLWGIIYPYTD